jgi:hypothetical protein
MVAPSKRVILKTKEFNAHRNEFEGIGSYSMARKNSSTNVLNNF